MLFQETMLGFWWGHTLVGWGLVMILGEQQTAASISFWTIDVQIELHTA